MESQRNLKRKDLDSKIDEEEDFYPHKPVQPMVTGEEFVRHPAVAVLIGKPAYKWTKNQKKNLALFLCNRSGIDLQKTLEPTRSQAKGVLSNIDELASSDKEVFLYCYYWYYYFCCY